MRITGIAGERRGKERRMRDEANEELEMGSERERKGCIEELIKKEENR